MAGERKGRRPTLKELAKEAGVSVASASYAVNGTGSVGEKTRAHILEVAQRVGYRQNAAARAMRSGRSGTLGLVIPDLTNPFFPSFAQAVVQTAREHQYGLFLTDTAGSEQSEREALAMLVDRGVDGVIWFPVHDADTSAGVLADVPAVVVDRVLPGFDAILADYAEGGRLAARHLLDQGHRRIGVITGPEDLWSMRERCDGAIRLIEAEGELAFKAANAFSIDLEPEVIDAIDRSGATAIFAGADIIAMGVIRHLSAAGRAVPDALSLVGFDDIPWAELCLPALTTIEMPLHAMAAEAVETVLRRIERGDAARRSIVFNTNLVLRHSVRAPPASAR